MLQITPLAAKVYSKIVQLNKEVRSGEIALELGVERFSNVRAILDELAKDGVMVAAHREDETDLWSINRNMDENARRLARRLLRFRQLSAAKPIVVDGRSAEEFIPENLGVNVVADALRSIRNSSHRWVSSKYVFEEVFEDEELVEQTLDYLCDVGLLRSSSYDAAASLRPAVFGELWVTEVDISDKPELLWLKRELVEYET